MGTLKQLPWISLHLGEQHSCSSSDLASEPTRNAHDGVLDSNQAGLTPAAPTLTSQARREAQAKHSTNVSLHGVAEDPFLQAHGCLVDKPRHQAHLDVLLGAATRKKESVRAVRLTQRLDGGVRETSRGGGKGSGLEGGEELVGKVPSLVRLRAAKCCAVTPGRHVGMARSPSGRMGTAPGDISASGCATALPREGQGSCSNPTLPLCQSPPWESFLQEVLKQGAKSTGVPLLLARAPQSHQPAPCTLLGDPNATWGDSTLNGVLLGSWSWEELSHHRYLHFRLGWHLEPCQDLIHARIHAPVLHPLLVNVKALPRLAACQGKKKNKTESHPATCLLRW